MNFKFFQNKECEYFPCHKINNEDFNCLFCYCPLYTLKDKCGGNFEYIQEGIKDCSKCTIVHYKDKSYDYVMSKMDKIINIAKKGDK